MSTDTPGYVADDGPKSAKWLFVGEAPGAMEAKYGLPFVGPSGELLWELAAFSNIERADVYVTNVWPWYRPGNPTPTPAETDGMAAEAAAARTNGKRRRKAVFMK